MRSQIEGSRAIAETVAACRPQVVPAYPITPQTHIVEAIGAMVKSGRLPARFVTVESEFAAMSVAIGASLTGARTYTATASQGLLYMAEAVFNAAGLGAPIVMTVANRAIGAPINIWNDQSDSISQRDCGWVQLYAADNQEAADLHAVAFALAEELSVPVMVCVDGFVLTHAFEPIDVPTPAQVDEFLPAYRPRQKLDPADPVAIGAMVGPEAFTEVRYLADRQLRSAQDVFPRLASYYHAITGRAVRPVTGYRIEGADTAVVSLGSVNGTVADVIDEVRDDGLAVGSVALTMYRPFPASSLSSLLWGVRRVVVLERSLSPGAQGALTADIRAAVGPWVDLHTVVAGLGGRAVGRASLRAAVQTAVAGRLPETSVLDLREDVEELEFQRNVGAAR